MPSNRFCVWFASSHKLQWIADCENVLKSKSFKAEGLTILRPTLEINTLSGITVSELRIICFDLLRVITEEGLKLSELRRLGTHPALKGGLTSLAG